MSMHDHPHMTDDKAPTKLLDHVLSTSDIYAGAPEYAVGRLLGQHGGIGTWRMELPSRQFQFSSKALEISGLDHSPDPVSLETVLSRFHKEDRGHAAKIIIEALRHKSAFTYKLRTYNRGGYLRAIECIGDVELDASGQVRALVGTIRDVSIIEKLENVATSRMLMIRALLRHIPMAIAVLDKSMNYISASQYWISGHGIKNAKNLIGKNHYDLFKITAKMKADHQRVLAGETLQRTRAFLKDKSGNPMKQQSVLTPWYNRDGSVGGIILMLKDVDTKNVLQSDDAGTALPKSGEFDELLATLTNA